MNNPMEYIFSWLLLFFKKRTIAILERYEQGAIVSFVTL